MSKIHLVISVEIKLSKNGFNVPCKLNITDLFLHRKARVYFNSQSATHSYAQTTRRILKVIIECIPAASSRLASKCDDSSI